MVVLDAETSPYVDVTAAEMLVQLRTTLRRQGIELRIALDIGQVRDVLREIARSGEAIPVPRTVDEAVAGERRPDPHR